jgi:CheY-like chemotaxis protein
MLFAPGTAFRASQGDNSRDGAKLTHDAQPRGAPRILVVDDDELTRYAIGRRLRQWGYEPVIFAQARDALEFLREGSSSALITDMYMPEATGLALVRAVRLVRPDMPIVLMTGNPDPELRRRACAHGVVEIVLKQAGSHGELRSALQRALVAGDSGVAPPGPTDEGADLAHSLRTPLTALKSAVDILCRGELTDAQRRFAAIAQRNADQMVFLVERLLDRTLAKP